MKNTNYPNNIVRVVKLPKDVDSKEWFNKSGKKDLEKEFSLNHHFIISNVRNCITVINKGGFFRDPNHYTYL